jgi:hypothetical protein
VTADATDPAAGSIRVTGGSPTDDEIAAIAAVFTQLALERAARVERVDGPEQRTEWDRTRRSLRTPLARHRRWPDR